MYKWIMFVLFFAACIIGLVGVISKIQPAQQQQAASQQNTAPKAPADATAAMATYKANCMVCHGANLEGKVGPNLQKIGRKLTFKQIYNQINNGGGAMPAFKGQVDDKQISNLANWLSSKN